ncbi:MAG: pyruvate:ferredoxin (flavodoxin) oxidoreductase [Bacilli bacterium]|nr:pyruvate:ferredoxin (flavodoxin) oxidoreductase [Bacilli bacterium]
MKKYKTMDGNEACSHIAYMFTEVAGIYPITPSSVMAEHIDEWSNEGRKNIFGSTVKVVEMQSEAGAAGMMHGSLQSGALTSTFTASQGLLLMIPNMYKMAGEMLPGVIHVAARSLSTHALSILGDHQDIYATRMTGFGMIASSSVQQVMDLSAISHLTAIKSRIPFMNFFDGFRTSHELQKIEILEESDVKGLLDMDAVNRFRNNSINNNKVVRGTAASEDIYFQMAEVRNKDYTDLPDTVNDYMKKISEITGRNYAPFVYYGNPNAKNIIVAMGSVCETIRETIDYIEGDIGLIEVHLYRPFSSKYLLDVLPKSVEKIVVLDRTKELGSTGEPLFLDIKSIVNVPVYGGRYGLSSKDTNPSQIKAIYDYMNNGTIFHGFTIGINDDVTNFSLKETPFEINDESVKEFLIYGYGSDGMVGASKDIIKLIGDNTESKVQGYFQYDSKKSGGLTRSHMRFSNKEIRSTYFVNNPHLVVCSKESYLNKYDMISNIRKDGIFIYVTNLNEEDFNKKLNKENVLKIINNNIKVYIIDAYSIAEKNNLKNKVSTILEVCILKLLNLSNFDLILSKMKDNISSRFGNKGEDIVKNNLNSIEEAISSLKLVSINQNLYSDELFTLGSGVKVFDYMNELRGDSLNVSDFLYMKNGTFNIGTTKFEKRSIAESIPVWNKDNCIQCNQCAMVCPHGVIRPYLLNEEELNNAPDSIKNDVIPAVGSDYKFKIGISHINCMGCSLCANVCPGKMGNKALTMEPIDTAKKDDKYLRTVSIKKDQVKNTIKGSQFNKPLFEFSGACAGCGETPYIKLLTQLLQDRLVIANATGCSSIYGASLPSIPYNIPWASSLFEDNAEYGYGMLIATNTIRNRIKNIMESNLETSNGNLFKEWLDNPNDYEISKHVYGNIDYSLVPELIELKEFIPYKSIWTIGGDGWAYDIGFGGIDHILSSNDNVNILVLDTEVYSNTGGQASKSSNKGAIAKFASSGKVTTKKDLAKIAMCYPNAYVAQVSLGANMQQTINAFLEAENHDGPSIIIAYSPCISHGIKGGMGNSNEQEKMAVKSGYFPIFRYNPKESKFTLDFKEPDFNLFNDFLNSQTRFSMLTKINEENGEQLLIDLKEEAIKRFEYYKNIEK